jgi:O-antigen/teichoic acid export membrane protein
MKAANRVAKNTVILYLRMAITVFISLYATRLVLAALGVADFGLFNVVGGVIAMLGFLNASMASATQRFMSYAQGEGNLEKVKRIFNMSTILHIAIAVLMVLVLEIAGYFFFNGILNIAPDRLEVAKIIYHFMVASTFFTVLSVPYEAVITSHENMLFYAVLGIIEAILKLGVALYITYSTLDHLVMYGLLTAALSVFLLILRRIYCHRYYQECVLNFRKYYEKNLLKEIGGFAGWSLMGSASSMLVNYGTTIVLNVFFGTVINAAQGVAIQINGQLNVFATTLIKALNPMIDKSEGAGDRALMLKATMMGSKVSFFLLMILYIPFFLELPFIFKLWLKNVPNYAIIFCRLLLIKGLIEQLFIPLTSAISAQGNIKAYQIWSSVLLYFPLTISFILFKFNYPPYSMYVVFIIYAILSSGITLYYTHKNCHLSIKEFLTNVVLRCFISLILVFCIALIPCLLLDISYLRLFLVVLISTTSYAIIVYAVGFSQNERLKIKQVGALLSGKLRLKKSII